MNTLMKSFPVGFWNYTSIDLLDHRAVDDWKDAGMTVAMSPEYRADPGHIARMHGILDAASARDIKLILCDERTYWRNLMKNGEQGYRAACGQAVQEFGSHPAVFGFHVGDEPDAANFPFACKAQRILKELAPHLHPFLNLLPWHAGCETRVGYADWALYLDDYVRMAQPDLLCYDCYSQMNPGTEGWDMYFKNLLEYQEAGRRHEIPFWNTILSVGHFRYRCPKEDDFRWQVNTSIAHGAQGLLYFFLYMRQPCDNYRVAPIDEHWERTETFEWLSRVNRTFLKQFAPVVRGLSLKTVSHVGKAWGGVKLFDGGGRVSRAVSNHGTPLIISEFAGADGSEFIAVVNNSQTDSTQASIWVSGRRPGVRRVCFDGSEMDMTAGDGWSAQKGEDFLAIFPWLAPGGMELYRVTET